MAGNKRRQSSGSRRQAPSRTRGSRVSSTPDSPHRSGRESGAARPAGARARIRVYRHGLGDCILVRLRRQDGTDFKILIDCGVAVAQARAVEKMTEVVEDIVRETQKKIDVLAVTHEHWDHVSGFTQASDAFKDLEVGEVWVAWTEDENDPLAKSLRKDHAKALAVLGASADRMALAGQDDRATYLHDIMGLRGAAGEKSKAAFDKAKAMGKQLSKPRYWQPDGQQHAPNQQIAPISLGDPEVTIYALGPPYDAKLIRKTLPSKSNPETYELKIDGGNLFPVSVMSALTADGSSSPFSPTVTIPMRKAKSMRFFQQRYWGRGGESAHWRRIDADWLGAAEDLALAMQSATNNTSLVLAIELAGGDVLLFAGDAQVGNWLSWQDRKWTVHGREVTGADLLARTIFYKVGHHGSHNATLREKGLDMMKNLETAVIPVDQDVAKKMRWNAMPLKSLVAALKTKTNGRTFRTDVEPSDIDAIKVTKLFYEFHF